MEKIIITIFAAITLLAVPISAQNLRGLPQGLSDAQVNSHIMAPEHTKDVNIEETNAGREVHYKFILPAKQFKKVPKLDTGAFGSAVHAILKDTVTGYILQIRHNGVLVHNLIWNWAQTPADHNKGWTEDTRMHVASVSKFLTAVAMVKVLDSKKISYDAKIAGYLPAYWTKGNNIDKITFRHLLTHKSGFNTGKSSSDYGFMKSKVAAGVPQVGGYDYENMNFGLCRILIPIILGEVDKNAVFIKDTALNDKAWDAITLYHYRSYCQNNLFTPAGVSNVGFVPTGTSALAYQFPHKNKKGWNSGDLSTVAGGAGWRLSTKELLNVLNHVRRKNTIISTTTAQYMLDNYFGIDQVIDTPAGKIYNKNGAWGANGNKEQCVAYFLPNGMELVLFVNSPIGADDFSLRGIVKDAFINSLAD